MSALTSVRYDPNPRTFYERNRAEGKNPRRGRLPAHLSGDRCPAAGRGHVEAADSAVILQREVVAIAFGGHSCGPVELALESRPSSAPPSAGVTPPQLPWRPRTSTAPVTVSRTERGSPCRW